jgi:hypothetical protein
MIGVVVGDVATGRTVTRDGARAIAGTLTRARLCVESNKETEIPPDELRDIGAAVVAVAWGHDVSASWRTALAGAGIEWALVRVPADDDDDPAWIESRIVESDTPRPAWVELEICPNLEDGWSVIAEPNDSDLETADLEALAQTHAIVFSLALRPDQAVSVRNTLTHARGFSFTLDGDGVIGAHRYDRDTLAAVLTYLHKHEG